ncbi:hypothetical protein KEF85_03770 [Methylomonas paludis]|uniref:Uncharacterized protein n=1 Tax=Methylomonas paludis TaxID=1173101 RepID=A0A975MPF8_9GAMM|nr:hypothetical protein [Methylomonas paludis]QWF71608.1 hypothetical protein KEF85_03770 [Methylomonas paludis]
MKILVIENLSDLDDQILDQGGGYWIKTEAQRVEVTNDVRMESVIR